MARRDRSDEMKKLPESELEIMLCIWRSGLAQVTSAYVGERLAEKGWADTTVLNFLTRLTDKGFLKREKQGKINLYTPLIQEEAYLRRESRHFLDKLYGNSAKNMLAAMYQEKVISDMDLAEIKAFIEEQAAALEGGKDNA